MPGCLIAMGRLNRPGADGLWRHDPRRAPGHDEKLDIVSAFQCYGEYLAGKIDEAEAPGRSCGTAVPAPVPAAACTRPTRWPRRSRRWACRCPTAASIPAEDPAKLDECFRAGAAIRMLLERDIKPRDIMTRAAFENAMVVVMALGGSTNAVLHLIAMARAVEVPLTIDDFQAVSDRAPVPGRSEAQRQIRAGRSARRRRHAGRDEVSAGKRAARRRLPDGDRQDDGAKTWQTCRGSSRASRSSSPLEKPIKPTGHIQILRGNLAPEGAVAKITGKEGTRFTGPAKVYDSRRGHARRARTQGDRQRETWSSFATKGPRAARACPRCSRPLRPSWAPAWAPTWR